MFSEYFLSSALKKIVHKREIIEINIMFASHTFSHFFYPTGTGIYYKVGFKYLYILSLICYREER